MQNLEELQSAINEMLKNTETSHPITLDINSVPQKCIYRCKKNSDERYLWISGANNTFTLLWGFSNDKGQSLDGRRFGNLTYALKVFKYWLIEWQDYQCIPLE